MAKKKMWVSHEKARRELGFHPAPADIALGARGGVVPLAGCMKILFVASDPMEFRGMLRYAHAVRPSDVVVDWSRKALLERR